MKHYLCSITFNNTSKTTTFSANDANGLRFYVNIVAEDKDKAKDVADKTAQDMFNNLFKNNEVLNECCYEDGHIYPILNEPNYAIKVDEVELVSNIGDTHNPQLRKAINEIWADDKYRSKLRIIMGAYFERDCEELANFYSDACVFWRANEMYYDDFLKICDFEELCGEMFSHILDDEDYRAIINFIRPKLSFVENWWEV